jgi:hypothetical protein
MFIAADQDAAASTVLTASDLPAAEPSCSQCDGEAFQGNRPPSTSESERVRHLLFGSLGAVRLTIQQLHKQGYAEVNDWSVPISTGRANEVMAILTKRVRVER